MNISISYIRIINLCRVTLGKKLIIKINNIDRRIFLSAILRVKHRTFWGNRRKVF